MKTTLLIALIFGGFTMNAQETPELSTPTPPPSKQMSIEDVSSTESEYIQAKKEYQNALKQLQQAKQAKIEAENKVEQSRVSLRSSELSIKREAKSNNPMVIEQYVPSINPIFEEMSKGSNYGLSTFIEGAKKDGITNVFSKNVDNEFKAYMKQFKASKVKKQKGELFFDNIIIPQMSATAMDIYTDFIDKEDGVEVRTYFNTGSSFQNFTEDSSSTDYANRLMERFAKFIRTKNLEAELADLEKEQTKTLKDAESNKEEIVKTKSEIQDMENKIAEMRNKIGEYDTAIDTINDKLEITREKLSKVN